MKFTAALTLFLFLFTFGATCIFPEDLIMEITPNPVGRDDKFNIDFFIDYDDMAGITIKTPVLPSGITLYKGPYKRPYWLQLSNGDSKKKTLITYTYSTGKEGRFVIDPFILSIGDRILSTKPELIRVGLYKNRELYIPYNVEWSYNDGLLYEGQAIPIILEVNDLEEVMFFEDITIDLPEKGFMDQVGDLGLVEVEQIGDYKLYTVPVRGFIFTPTVSGRIKIPSGTVIARGISSSSGSPVINVKQIPGKIENTGALGNFTISSWVTKSEIFRNEKIELHIKVEGVGNFNYFQLQEPYGEGLTLAGMVEIPDYLTTSKGFEGSRETVYSFISDSQGDKELIVPAFPFLIPDTGIIIEGKIISIPLQINTSSNLLPKHDIEEYFPFKPRSFEADSFSSSSRYKDPSSYLWFLPGPLVFFIFLLTGKKKVILGASIIFIAAAGDINIDLAMDNAIQQYEKGNYYEAIEMFQELEDENEYNPSFSYNLALSYYQIGDYGRSVYESRMAFYHDPLNSDYRDLVAYIEQIRGIAYPIELSFNLYPDAFLFLLMILVNLSAFIGVIYLVEKKNIYFIVSVLVLGFSFLSLGGLGFSIIQKERLVGVVIGEQAEIKKIPIGESEILTAISSGESVQVKGESDEFLFINTGTGIKGWVDKSDILILED
jgi:hypothetical protein